MGAASSRGGRSDVTAIGASLWKEFMVPYFQREGENEARFFAEALEARDSELLSEAREHWQRGKEAENRLRPAREELRVASRSFFSLENEKVLVRPVAITLGYIPGAVDVLRSSRAELDQAIDGHEPSLLGKAFFVDRQGVRRVCGTQAIFPENGPICKYCALFDHRECFDALREAFLVASDPHNTTEHFQTVTGDMLGTDEVLRYEHVVSAGIEFIDRIHALAKDILAPPDAPVNFALRAWKAYLDALRNENYYLSVPELLVISRCARRNVVIMQQHDEKLHYLGATDLSGPIIFAKIKGVRGHFERVLREDEVLGIEAQTRADNEAEKKLLHEEVERRRAKEVEDERRERALEASKRLEQERLAAEQQARDREEKRLAEQRRVRECEERGLREVRRRLAPSGVSRYSEVTQRLKRKRDEEERCREELENNKKQRLAPGGGQGSSYAVNQLHPPSGSDCATVRDDAAVSQSEQGAETLSNEAALRGDPLDSACPDPLWRRARGSKEAEEQRTCTREEHGKQSELELENLKFDMRRAAECDDFELAKKIQEQVRSIEATLEIEQLKRDMHRAAACDDFELAKTLQEQVRSKEAALQLSKEDEARLKDAALNSDPHDSACPDPENEQASTAAGTSRRVEAQWRALSSIRLREERPRRYEAELLSDAAESVANECLRDRVTLPPNPKKPAEPWTEVESGGRLPPVTCAFRNCTWHCNREKWDRKAVWEKYQEHPCDHALREHVLAAHDEELRARVESRVVAARAKEFLYDVYLEALAVKERQGIPAHGPSIERRTFEYTEIAYNDKRTRSLICGLCARTSVDTGRLRSDISFVHGGWLFKLPPKTLLNNFSKAEFERRYQKEETPLSPSQHRVPDFSDWLLDVHPMV